MGYVAKCQACYALRTTSRMPHPGGLACNGEGGDTGTGWLWLSHKDCCLWE